MNYEVSVKMFFVASALAFEVYMKKPSFETCFKLH